MYKEDENEEGLNEFDPKSLNPQYEVKRNKLTPGMLTSAGILSQSRMSELSKPVARDGNGEIKNTTVVCLNEEDYKNNFEAPFTVVIGASMDKEAFHDSVVRFIHDNGIEDTTLRNRFKSWFCATFGVAQDIFDDANKMKSTTDRISDAYTIAHKMRDDVTKAPEIKVISIAKEGEADERFD